MTDSPASLANAAATGVSGGIPAIPAAVFHPQRTAIAYALVASAWIFASDWGLEWLLGFREPTLQWSLLKGAAFVAVTTGLLYAILRRYARRAEMETARWKAAQRELATTEERLRSAILRSEQGSAARETAETQLRILLSAVEQSPASIVITDTEGQIEYVNPKFTQVTGYTLEEAQGKNTRILKSGLNNPALYRDLWATLRAGREWRGEFHNRKKDGATFWEKVAITPISDAAGKVTHFVGVKEDVTESRRAADALRESEEMYRTLVTATPDAIAVLSPDGRVTYSSPRARVLFGQRESAEQRLMLDSVAPCDRARATQAFRDVLETGGIGSGEFSLLRWDGSTFLAEINAAPLRGSDQAIKGVALVARDVTDRKHAEDRLHASEERFRELVETISEVFWVYDPRVDRLTYLSPSFERVWGRPCGALLENRAVWVESLHRDDRDHVLSDYQRIGSSAADAPAELEVTYRIVRPDGTTRWIRDKAFCVRDASGAVSRVIGVAEDITEQKEIEKQFLRAQRLEAIGTLASGVAHDMNNILAPMLVVPALIKERLRDPADRQLLGIVEQSAQRGAGIVRQLLTFSRGADGERGPVQIAHLTKEMLHIVRETFPREIAVTGHIPADLPSVHCDPTQIHQVLMNLCVNARDAMPHGGELTLSARETSLDAPGCRVHQSARPGLYVVLTVDDTGHGIPPEIIDRIFDPFFTTKEVGKGTGLGLSTVLGIVNGHGGFVLVDSKVGEGTCFSIYLPASGEALDAARKGTSTPFVRGAGEMVLVVDDEEAVRDSTRLLLQKQGYRVATAVDGRAALAALTPEVRLVLTDMMMPNMNGFGLVRALRAVAPSVRIVATTGLDHVVEGERLAALGVTELVHKPCDATRLLEAIDRELNAHRC
jgi:PAS domain S-box-containing protein